MQFLEFSSLLYFGHVPLVYIFLSFGGLWPLNILIYCNKDRSIYRYGETQYRPSSSQQTHFLMRGVGPGMTVTNDRVYSTACSGSPQEALHLH